MKEIIKTVYFDEKENPSYKDLAELSVNLEPNQLILVYWTLADGIHRGFIDQSVNLIFID